MVRVPSSPPPPDDRPSLQRWRLAIAQALIHRVHRSADERSQEEWTRILQTGVMTTLAAILLQQLVRHNRSRVDAQDGLTQWLPMVWQTQLQPLGGLESLIQDIPWDNPPLPALGIEHLGQMFELGLACPLERTAQGTVAIAPPASRKKTGGVYYTPRAIAEYMLQQILQPWETQHLATPGDRCPLPTLLDPACGSGIFLLVAYEQLCQYALRWYHAQGDRSAADRGPALQRNSQGDWQLAPWETARILNHLYGIDQDGDAVAVTRLSLQMAALAAGGGWSIVPPGLEQRILVGNALMQADATHPEGLQASPAFTQVLQQGGFDGVMGNPPYIDAEEMTRHHAALRTYCNAQYRTAAGNWDLFCVFIERAMIWCKPGGWHSFIVPNKLVSAGYAAPVRSLLIHHQLHSIRSYAHVPTFRAAVYPLVYVVQKQPASVESCLHYEVMADVEQVAHSYPIPYSTLLTHPDTPWPLGNAPLMQVMARLHQDWPPLAAVAEVWGAATVAEAYALKPLIQDNPYPEAQDLKLVNSGTIDRYHLLWGDRPMRYLGDRFLHPVLPQDALQQIPARRWHQATQAKIIVAGLSKRLECCIDDQGTVLAAKSTSIIVSHLNLYYLLGILNSQLMQIYVTSYFGHNQLQGQYLRIGPPQLKPLPIAMPQGRDGEKLSQQLIQRVQQRLAGHRDSPLPGPPEGGWEPSLDLERQIDSLVYDLYGLTEADRRFVERAGLEISG